MNDEEQWKKYYAKIYNMPLFNMVINGIMISDLSHKQCNQIMRAVIEGKLNKKKEEDL